MRHPRRIEFPQMKMQRYGPRVAHTFQFVWNVCDKQDVE